MAAFLNESLLFYTLCIAAQYQCIKEAADLVLKKEKTVLLDDPSFVGEDNRTLSLKYLRLRGIEPTLLIVRATHEQVMRVAQERSDTPLNRGLWHGRAGMILDSMVDDHYTNTEGWRVIVADNTKTPEAAVSTIRSKLAAKVFGEVEGRVNFVI